MAKAFTRFMIDDLPNQDVVSTNFQLALEIPEGPYNDEAHSSLRFDGPSDHAEFLRYKAHHEIVEKRLVRWLNTEYPEIVHIVKLNAFRRRDSNAFYFQGKERYAVDFLRKLRSSNHNMSIEGRRVDLMRMREELESDVKGGWFKDLRISNVKTAAIYGAAVTSSSEWRRFEERGTISSLQVELDLSAGPMSLIITSRGGIVFQNRLNERAALDLLIQVDGTVQRFTEEEGVPINRR